MYQRLKFLLCIFLIFSLARCDLEGLIEESEVVEPSIPSGRGASGESRWQEDENLKATFQAESKPAKAEKAEAPSRPPVVKSPGQYYLEWLLGAFIILYAANYWIGRGTNRKLAEKWATSFASPGSVLEKNFSLVGFGEGAKKSLLISEGASHFKGYASGRRYCQGLLASMNLQPRQDIISLIGSLLSPSEDSVTLEVYMLEAHMPTCIMLVGTNKAARVFQRDVEDMVYTKKVAINKGQLPSWPVDSLTVLSEASSVFHDIFSDPRLQQLFNPEGQFQAALTYFRSIYCTPESTEGSYKQLLRFTFALPPADDMDVLLPLMMLVPVLIDLIGTYKLPAETKKKIAEARQRVQDAKKKENLEATNRNEAAEKRRAEKLQAQKDRVARMTPEQRLKHDEKERKKELKTQFRFKYK